MQHAPEEQQAAQASPSKLGHWHWLLDKSMQEPHGRGPLTFHVILNMRQCLIRCHKPYMQPSSGRWSCDARCSGPETSGTTLAHLAEAVHDVDLVVGEQAVLGGPRQHVLPDLHALERQAHAPHLKHSPGYIYSAARAGVDALSWALPSWASGRAPSTSKQAMMKCATPTSSALLAAKGPPAGGWLSAFSRALTAPSPCRPRACRGAKSGSKRTHAQHPLHVTHKEALSPNHQCAPVIPQRGHLDVR